MRVSRPKLEVPMQPQQPFGGIPSPDQSAEPIVNANKRHPTPPIRATRVADSVVRISPTDRKTPPFGVDLAFERSANLLMLQMSCYDDPRQPVNVRLRANECCQMATAMRNPPSAIVIPALQGQCPVPAPRPSLLRKQESRPIPLESPFGKGGND